MDSLELKGYIQTHLPESLQRIMVLMEEIGEKAFADMQNVSASNTFVLNVLSLFFSQFLTAYIRNHNPRPIKELGDEIYREFQNQLREILLKHSNGKTTFEIEIPLKKEDFK